jgi:hypothetical protein
VSEPLVAVTAAAIIVFAAWGLMFALLKAAQHPHPTAMVTALALLTLLSLLGLAISDGEAANTFGTLAATGMGALAGAVTSTFGTQPTKKGPTDGQDQEETRRQQD